jgi:hypothetical protein
MQISHRRMRSTLGQLEQGRRFDKVNYSRSSIGVQSNTYCLKRYGKLSFSTFSCSVDALGMIEVGEILGMQVSRA